jgi:hypothetical protein
MYSLGHLNINDHLEMVLCHVDLLDSLKAAHIYSLQYVQPLNNPLKCFPDGPSLLWQLGVRAISPNGQSNGLTAKSVKSTMPAPKGFLPDRMSNFSNQVGYYTH